MSGLTVDRKMPPEPGIAAGASIFAPARDLGLPYADQDTVNQALVLVNISRATVDSMPGTSSTWVVYPLERLDLNIRENITTPTKNPASGELFDAFKSVGNTLLLVLKDRSGSCESTQGNYLDGDWPTPVWNCEFKSPDRGWYARYAASSFAPEQLPRVHRLVTKAAAPVMSCLQAVWDAAKQPTEAE